MIPIHYKITKFSLYLYRFASQFRKNYNLVCKQFWYTHYLVPVRDDWLKISALTQLYIDLLSTEELLWFHASIYKPWEKRSNPQTGNNGKVTLICVWAIAANAELQLGYIELRVIHLLYPFARTCDTVAPLKNLIYNHRGIWYTETRPYAGKISFHRKPRSLS